MQEVVNLNSDFQDDTQISMALAWMMTALAKITDKKT